MKKSLLILFLLSISFVQSQTLDEVVKQKIQFNSYSENIREGILEIDAICSQAPSEKCNKGKSFGYYILSSRYYDQANSLKSLDAELAAMAVSKAEDLYNLANSLYPETQLTDQQQNLLLNSRRKHQMY